MSSDELDIKCIEIAVNSFKRKQDVLCPSPETLAKRATEILKAYKLMRSLSE